MERGFAVISALGTDRVGIVDDITAVLVEKKCNIEESRMSLLGGEFAIVMLVSGEGPILDGLIPELAGVGARMGLHIEGKRTNAPTPQGGLPYVIESTSLDTPGILHSVTALLRGEKINIEDLETETTAAPWTGAPMFLMRLRVVVPQSTKIATLRREIEGLAEKQDLDIKLYPAAPGRQE
jgi:glycine cleavage system transcriptional repressor